MIVTTRRDARTGRRVGQGGGRWSKWHRDLTIQMRTKPGNDVRFTTLFDVYGLPADFPSLAEAAREPTSDARVQRLQEAMSAALDDWRLIPYLQLHEFEAYVFVDLAPLEALLDDAEDRRRLAGLGQAVAGIPPEEIDDGAETAPSKRLAAHLGAAYQKVVHGPLVTEVIGLARIRARCPRFDRWLTVLEQLG